MKLPELAEGWSWKVTRPVEVVEAKDGPVLYPKVRIELVCQGVIRRHATIDVKMYGDTAAVVERAQAMVKSVAAEQMQAMTLLKAGNRTDLDEFINELGLADEVAAPQDGDPCPRCESTDTWVAADWDAPIVVCRDCRHGT